MSNCLLCALIIALPLFSAPQNTLASPLDALSGGKLSLGWRYRLEQVRQPDAFDQDAVANTLRTRLGYRSGEWAGWRLQAEFDQVAWLFDDRFNSTRNGQSTFPTVADPKGADLNQFALHWQPDEQLALTLGRQRLQLDNQRFVGAVGWRQNEQTFDAVSLRYRMPAALTWHYAWLGHIRRVFGPEEGAPPAVLDSNSHLLNARLLAGPVTLVGYGYALAFDNAPALSSLTAGLRAQASPVLGDWRFPLTAEAARQRDHDANPQRYRADYLLLEAGAGWRGYLLTLGQERLGADRDAGVALQTPLATLHAFQGFADVFLTTPPAGLVDQYVRVAVPTGAVQWTLGAHRFEAATGDAAYGREWNLSAGWQARHWLHLLVKAADYQAREFSVDTRKLWLQATLNF